MHDVFILKQTNNNDTVEKIQQHFPYARCVEHSVDIKQLIKSVAQKSVTEHVWLFSDNCDYDNFDFEYVPPWHQNQQLHVWPNSTTKSQSGDTVLFHRREFLKQIDSIESIQDFDCVNWKDQAVPNIAAPEIVIWDRYNNLNQTNMRSFPSTRVMRYIGTPLDMLRKTVMRATTPYIWIIDTNIDYSNFDFSWRPDWTYQNYLHVWPNAAPSQGGTTMFINVKHFLDQAENIERLEHYQNILWHKKTLQPIVPTPKICVGVDVRNIGTRLDVLKRACRTATTPYVWIVNPNVDYTGFDFSWQPTWATDSHLHVWCNGEQRNNGDTYFVNVAEFNRQAVALEHLEDYEVINWKTYKLPELVEPEVYIWDSVNDSARLLEQFPNATVIRSIGTELDMMNRTLRKATTEYIWVLNSKCDYTNFNFFNWRPSWAQEKHMHVWPTENQTKGGDTYFLNVAEARSQLLNLERLEDYNVINWHKTWVKEKNSPQVVAWSRTGENVDKADITLRSLGTQLEMVSRTLRKVDTPYFWIINENCDYTKFDFKWRPSWSTQNQLHVWPTEDQIMGGDTMYVNTAEMKSQLLNLENLENYEVINWHKKHISQLVKPKIIGWSRTGKWVDGADITLRYIGSELDMMNRTLGKVDTPSFWIISDMCDYSNFNFNWRPTWATETQLHVWPTENQTKGGDTMYVNTAEMKSQAIKLEHLEHYDVINWHSQCVTQSTKPQIVAWSRSGNAVEGADITIRYIGSELDMMSRTLRKVETPSFWVISDTCDYTNFDLNWRPGWAKQSYLHVWPTENQVKGGDTMYVNTAEMKSQLLNLENLEHYDVIDWHSKRVAQITKPQIVAWSHSGKSVEGADVTLRYIGSELDMMNRTLRKVKTPSFWVISDTCDYTDFDFGYRPGWAKQNYLHVWPTERQDKGGDTMYVNTAEMKSQAVSLEHLEHYDVIDWQQNSVKQRTKPQIVAWSRTGADVEGADITLRYLGSELDMMNRTLSKVSTSYFWVISDICNYTDFDFNWRPTWATQTYLHVWPTENQVKGGDTMYVNTAEMKSQVISLEHLEHYDVINWQQDSIKQQIQPEVFVWDSTGNTDLFPNATVLRNVGDKFGMLEKTMRRASTPYIWILNSNNDYSDFDLNWRPSWATQSHLHVWPSGTQTHGGDTMYVNVAEFKKQALEIELLEQYVPINWHSTVVEQTRKPEIIVWDGGDNTDYIKERFPDSQAMRNIGSRYDMMCRTMRHVKSDTAWVVNSKCDYSQFDFDWRPGWDTETQLHVWPTENQVKGGDTYYVDVREFKKQSLEITDLDQYNSVNWHKQNLRLQTTSDIIIWTFGGNEDNLDSIKKQYPNAKSLRYVGTHLEMVKKSAKYATTDYFWVLSDCCNYIDFDANWRPDWETENSIHCWASGEQKFGDTFYVPKKQFLQEADNLDKLEYYSSVIWYEHGYSRFQWPVTQLESVDIFSSIRNHNFSSIYEYFVAPGSTLGSTVDVNLWEKRPLIAFNKNGHVSLCPRDCISEISTRLADYPYIKYHSCKNSTQKPQDIVFISYDEKDADLNYEILKKQHPQAKRVHGVDGMVNALKEAAKKCATPWYFAVFARTEVAEEFKFDFNPDYLETPGNYIFNAYNRITRNTYGHGAVLLYHCKTVIEAETWGYDFTTSFPYTAIPLLSCYNDARTPWEAWRTSFREVLKLKSMTTVESQYRLDQWLTIGEGDVGKWSIAGAKDAIEYTGNIEHANDWLWLDSFFKEKHPQHQ